MGQTPLMNNSPHADYEYRLTYLQHPRHSQSRSAVFTAGKLEAILYENVSHKR